MCRAHYRQDDRRRRCCALSDKYVLALDQGTTGSTAMVFDRDLGVRGRAYREVPQGYPRSGWVEHDPNQLWTSALEAGREALRNAAIAPTDLAAIGLTNQRETTVLWDRKTHAPVHPAIVWQCRRSAPICEQWRRVGLEPIIRQHTGLEVDAYFSASKVRWLLDNVPGLEARARSDAIAFGTVDTWLLSKLTNAAAHATDPSNASRTMLFNIHDAAWDKDLLAAFDIPEEILPEVHPSVHHFGSTAAEHFGAEIPIAGIAGDQQAALFGQACTTAGSAKNTYGTGCFLMMNTGATAVASSNRLLTTVAWQLAGQPVQYALEGSVFSAGSAVQWLRDGLGVIGRASETEDLARSVRGNGGVYIVPAFTGLGAPHWDMYARGAILGLTRDSTRAHVARAVLEAVAYQTRDLLCAMRNDSRHPLASLRVDGGMVCNDFLMQFQADILNVPVERPHTPESTVLGAACLAGLGAGVWDSLGDIARRIQIERVFEPRMSEDERESLYAEWQRALQRARDWAVPEKVPVGAG